MSSMSSRHHHPTPPNPSHSKAVQSVPPDFLLQTSLSSQSFGSTRRAVSDLPHVELKHFARRYRRVVSGGTSSLTPESSEMSMSFPPNLDSMSQEYHDYMSLIPSPSKSLSSKTIMFPPTPASSTHPSGFLKQSSLPPPLPKPSLVPAPPTSQRPSHLSPSTDDTPHAIPPFTMPQFRKSRSIVPPKPIVPSTSPIIRKRSLSPVVSPRSSQPSVTNSDTNLEMDESSILPTPYLLKLLCGPGALSSLLTFLSLIPIDFAMPTIITFIQPPYSDTPMIPEADILHKMNSGITTIKVKLLYNGASFPTCGMHLTPLTTYGVPLPSSDILSLTPTPPTGLGSPLLEGMISQFAIKMIGRMFIGCFGDVPPLPLQMERDAGCIIFSENKNSGASIYCDMIASPDHLAEWLKRCLSTKLISKPLLMRHPSKHERGETVIGWSDASLTELKSIMNILSRKLAATLAPESIEYFSETVFSTHVIKRAIINGDPTLRAYSKRVKESYEECISLVNSILGLPIPFIGQTSNYQVLLDKVVLKLINLAKGRGGMNSIRIWVAGCSEGEDVISLLYLIQDMLKLSNLTPCKIEIVGSDFMETLLSTAREGLYSKYLLEGVPQRWKELFINNGDDVISTNDGPSNPPRKLPLNCHEPSSNTVDTLFKVNVPSNITFTHRGLLQSCGEPNYFDIIVCRNRLSKLCYYAQERILLNFKTCLVKGGVIFLGQHDTPLARLPRLLHSFKIIDPSGVLLSYSTRPLLSPALLKSDSEDETLPVSARRKSDPIEAKEPQTLRRFVPNAESVAKAVDGDTRAILLQKRIDELEDRNRQLEFNTQGLVARLNKSLAFNAEFEAYSGGCDMILVSKTLKILTIKLAESSMYKSVMASLDTSQMIGCDINSLCVSFVNLEELISRAFKSKNGFLRQEFQMSASDYCIVSAIRFDSFRRSSLAVSDTSFFSHARDTSPSINENENEKELVALIFTPLYDRTLSLATTTTNDYNAYQHNILIQNSPCGILIVIEDVITFCNQSAIELFEAGKSNRVVSHNVQYFFDDIGPIISKCQSGENVKSVVRMKSIRGLKRWMSVKAIRSYTTGQSCVLLFIYEMTSSSTNNTKNSSIRHLLNQSTNALFLCQLDGTIIVANDSLPIFLNQMVTHSSLEGQNYRNVLPEMVATPVTEALNGVEKNTVLVNQIWRISFSWPTSSGDERQYTVTVGFVGNVMTSSNLNSSLSNVGDIELLWGTIVDVTDVNRAEELYAEKEIAVGISEYRSLFLENTINYISENTSEIATQIESVATQSTSSMKDNEIIQNTKNRTSCILNHLSKLFDLVRLDNGRYPITYEPFSLYDMFHEISDEIYLAAIQKGIHLVCWYDSKAPVWVVGDQQCIKRVLYNIVNNAVRFTSEGHVKVGIHIAPKKIMFVVEDTGSGVSKADMELFWGSSADSKSLPMSASRGFGLSICKLLVERMDGKIGVNTELGKGSRFWFEISLPTPDLEELTVHQREHVIINQPWYDIVGSNVCAMVVDDIPSQSRVIAGYLSNASVEVTVLSAEDLSLSKIENFVVDRSQVGFTQFLLVCSMAAMDAIPSVTENKGIHGFADTLRKINIALVVVVPSSCRDTVPQLKAQGLTNYALTPLRPDKLLHVVKDSLIPCEETVAITNTTEGQFEDSITPDSDTTTDDQKEHIDNESKKFQGVRVLVVEDNKLNQRVARKMLQNLGCEVMIASDGDECLQYLENNIPDLVFMDLKMPGKDGFETTRLIRELESRLSTPRLPIVALTGTTMPDEVDLCFTTGMDEFLSKPISKTELEYAIKKFRRQTFYRRRVVVLRKNV